MRRESLVQPEHLERLALVYVRQSTPGQVLENQESTRLQYGLRERAEQLGWAPERIQTIDEDLGVSGSGQQERRGFARLVLAVARKQVGAVFGLDASRFSRNGAEWFELLRWLRATGTLLVTDEGVYDAVSGDDSFVLGMHGTLSEAELYRIKARMEKGKLSKASRGELYQGVPTGYVLDGTQLRKDPDAHVQEAIGMVFAKFRELGTARQVARNLRAAGVKLPSRHGDERGLAWHEATYSRVSNVLRHPVMGGAYAWGRTRTSVQLDERDQARKSQRKLPMEDWRVLLPEHHEGYVEWEEWLEIQERLRANSFAGEGGGAPREGRALLQGLGTCGHCGRSMQVHYASAVQYVCRHGQDGQGGCQKLGGGRLDRLVAEALLEVLGPAGVEAALRAEQIQEEDTERQLLGYRREVERREWEERKAAREYRAIEPEFRRVKTTLARDWERAQEALEQARQALEQARQGLPSRPAAPPVEVAFNGLSERLRAVWEHPATSWKDRKRLLSTVLEEAVLTADRERRKLHVLLRWRGGWIDERELPLRPPPRGVRTEPETVDWIRRLAEFHADPALAEELNRRGLKTARGLVFTAHRVAALRATHGIPAAGRKPVEGTAAVAVSEAARELGTSVSSLYRWIEQGLVPAERAGPEGPLRVRLDESVRARFCDSVPDGYVSAAEARRELGVSRQTLWSQIQAGSLSALHVVRGAHKGLYVRWDESVQPLLTGLEAAAQD